MMSHMERRPHWDDDLIDAVATYVCEQWGVGVTEPQVYPLIAAVEDWHTRRHHVPDAFGDRCFTCERSWPCPTIRLLDEDDE